MPHITEEIWQLVTNDSHKKHASSIMLTQYPVYNQGWKDELSESKLNTAIEAIKACRNIRQSFNIAPSVSLPIYIYCEEMDQKETFELVSTYIETFARSQRLSISLKYLIAFLLNQQQQ